jgi:predicted amidohydrolase
MHLACVQLDVDAGAPEANLSRAETAVREAAADGADLVVLPEQFVVGFFAFEAYPTHAAGLADPLVGRLADLAADAGVGLLAGSLVEDLAASADAGYDTPAETGYANTSLFFDRDGTLRTVYRKHHLFGYDSAEADLLVAGDSLSVVEFAGLTIGTTTCYDLRFPDLYRRLVELGAELILVPSAWPYPRVEHWRTLGRARAIENLAFVATVNGSGSFPAADATLCGRSTVYDPWGTTLASSGADPTTLAVDLDPSTVRTVRSSFPALADSRRLDR